MDPSPPGNAEDLTARWLLVLLVVFAALSLLLYWTAFPGPFVSDDVQFVLQNPDVRGGGRIPDLDVFDPRAESHFWAGGSYMPVTHLALAIEWRLFGTWTPGWHAANALLHAVCATLFVSLLVRTAVPRRAALLAGALFLAHPANVDAVAWISQIRTLLAFAFAFAALHLLAVRPAWSALPFTLGLLSKATAAFALPMGAALVWVWHGRGAAVRQPARALALWALALLVFAPIELGGLATLPSDAIRSYADLPTALRTVAAIGARYLAMAATGFGTAAFHEPSPVEDWLDPWWLAGVALAPLLLWRVVDSLRRRSPEAVWWVGAGAAWAPVSQVVPFFFPMADRYLYFILPGLLGGSLLAGRDLLGRLRSRTPRLAGVAERVVPVAALGLVVLLAVQATRRAELWVDPERLAEDTARLYPDGMVGHHVAARQALERGEVDRALEHLRASVRRGGFLVQNLPEDPTFRPLHDDPRFHEVLREYASLRVAHLGEEPGEEPGEGPAEGVAEGVAERVERSPHVAKSLAEAHYLLGEYDEAIAVCEAAIRRGAGPLRSALVSLAIDARRARARRRALDAAVPESEPGPSP